ncbi:FtsK/SpoIIIE domain-containing protein [Paraoerskovia sediminicola]|uniref:FtsK/SpoIIIE domain-containing protein n=1 Tax=Paraoerskovia sediminicola TaxID=1138587 RepID=UPI002573EACD|nr:FtsK/SpoIIIE domain-containing protein [Paraoerskovia sediminicola]
MSAPIGRSADGTVDLDLAGGPHTLIAGTTGSGKSGLLQALVLGLALRYPPDLVSLVLVDFKGGAGFGRCASLPHVVGTVTDLDAGLAVRALAGIRAELGRREKVLAEHGAQHVDDLPRGTLPRIVLVLDEFRALADDHPEVLAGIMRVAAQGRSLGMHLVLATQRPAGAVNAEIRANVTLRIALRTVERSESLDIVDVPDAAAIPSGTPAGPWSAARTGSRSPCSALSSRAPVDPATAGSAAHPPGAHQPVGRARTHRPRT